MLGGNQRRTNASDEPSLASSVEYVRYYLYMYEREELGDVLLEAHAADSNDKGSIM